MTTKSTETRAAIYCRISKDKTGQRAGVERQLADCQALAERSGWPVVRTYTDNDISAYSGKLRPQYQQLCVDIEAGAINTVICWHPDRLHRSPTELEDYIRLCGELVQNTTVTAGFWDLSTPSGRMNARNMGNYARYESEHKSERVRAAKMTAAKNGEHNTGIRTWGYEPDGMTIRESEAVEIRAIADGILKGLSLRSMARELNQRGISTVTGNAPWTQAKLRGVMVSPRLAGLRVHHGKVVGKGKWGAILDETTYAAMLSVLTDPKRTTAGQKMGRVPTSLGTGLYVCGGCGQPTLRLSRDNAGNSTYRCGGALDASAPGPHVHRRAESLDEFVTDAIIARLSQPGFVQAMADRVSAGNSADAAALIAERDAHTRASDELAAASESAAITPALALTLARQVRELTARADEITHLLAQNGRRSPVADLIGADDIAAAWHALSLPVQRAILAAVVTVTVRPGKKGPVFDPHSIVLDFK